MKGKRAKGEEMKEGVLKMKSRRFTYNPRVNSVQGFPGDVLRVVYELFEFPTTIDDVHFRLEKNKNTGNM